MSTTITHKSHSHTTAASSTMFEASRRVWSALTGHPPLHAARPTPVESRDCGAFNEGDYVFRALTQQPAAASDASSLSSSSSSRPSLWRMLGLATASCAAPTPTLPPTAGVCEEVMVFPSSFMMVAPPRPPLPTLASSLSVQEQAARLEATCPYGLPSVENIVVRAPYVASLNFRTRCPNWVAESYAGQQFASNSNSNKKSKVPERGQWGDDTSTSTSNSTKVDRKKLVFRGDLAVPAAFRASPTDYAGCGLARGHLAPAASHAEDELACAETFLLGANIVPQHAGMNGGDWLKLERLARALTAHFTHVRVVTGPLFLPVWRGGRQVVEYPLVGAAGVAVPTHLFKVIYCEEPASPEAKHALSGAFSPGILRSLTHVPLPASSVATPPSVAADTSPAARAKALATGAQPAGFALPFDTASAAGRALGPVLNPHSGALITTAANGLRPDDATPRRVLVAAFVVPNSAEGVDRPLAEYARPLAEVERQSGLCLTPRSSPLAVTMTTAPQHA